MLLLPQTLTARDSAARIAALREELPDSALPLEAFLEKGGWPGETRLSLRGEIREDDHEIMIPLRIEFIELCPAACPASSTPEWRTAYLTVRIRKTDARAEIACD